MRVYSKGTKVLYTTPGERSLREGTIKAMDEENGELLYDLTDGKWIYHDQVIKDVLEDEESA
jgi:hypothetical protein